MSDAYVEGYATGGKNAVRNPYKLHSEDYILWETGWREAREAARDNLRNWW